MKIIIIKKFEQEISQTTSCFLLNSLVDASVIAKFICLRK